MPSALKYQDGSADANPDPSPSKKRKAAITSSTKAKAKTKTTTDSALRDCRAKLANEIIIRGVAAASADAVAVAAATGLTVAQVRNQLSPGRSNLRKSLTEAAKNA